jgi:4'-phosphopantetheinyl transferase
MRRGVPLHRLRGDCDVDIWRAELDAGGWAGESRLPPVERRRAASILDPRSRRRWVASRWALRHVLGRLLDEGPRRVDLEAAAGGKPELASGELRFSLSHSGSLALIAVSPDLEVGVDIEQIRPHRAFGRLAERFLDPAAAAEVRRAPRRARPRSFYRAWTRHEAARKLAGCDPSVIATEDDFELVDLAPGRGFAAALAIGGGRWGP